MSMTEEDEKSEKLFKASYDRLAKGLSQALADQIIAMARENEDGKLEVEQQTAIITAFVDGARMAISTIPYSVQPTVTKMMADRLQQPYKEGRG